MFALFVDKNNFPAAKLDLIHFELNSNILGTVVFDNSFVSFLLHDLVSPNALKIDVFDYYHTVV